MWMDLENITLSEIKSDVCVCAKFLQLCPTLCDHMDCSLTGSSVHGILQARILEWVAMPSSRGFSQPRDKICISHISCIGRWVLHPCATWEALWLHEDTARRQLSTT